LDGVVTAGNEEADILLALEEGNADRYEIVAGSFLVKAKCVGCKGADCFVIPEKVDVARCIECGRVNQDIQHAWFEPVGMWHPTVGYPRANVTLAEPERPAHPDPIVTSRMYIPVAVEIPGPVIELRQHAAMHDWRIRTQYAKGRRLHSSTGLPTALVHSWAVRIGDHPDTSARAVAVYVSDAHGKNWTWKSVWMFGPELKPFGQGGITDLKDWLGNGGWVPDSWYSDIAERVAGQERERKRREACNRGTHVAILTVRGSDVVTCQDCGNSWKDGERPWKKAGKAKEHS
jgi:hypothetical protein